MNVEMGVRSMMGAGRYVDPGVGFGGMHWATHAVFAVFVVASIAVLVWALLRKPKAASVALIAAAPAADAALTIARERLARGEIEPEQYVAILTALTGASAPSAPAGASPLDG